MIELTQKRLKELLHYDPDTGIFTWLIDYKTKGRVSCEVLPHYNQGYACIHLDGKQRKMHRLAFLYMEGEFPTDCVDHINRVRNDNKWSNLRHASRSVNNHNTKNNNKVIGVCFHRASCKWTAYGNRNEGGVLPYLGIYENWFEAVCARKSWECS